MFAQRSEFDELFLQLIYLLNQRLRLFPILLLCGLRKLTREIENLAIGLGLPLVIGRWCQRRFVRPPLAWRRSAVGVAHRAAPPKYQSATISGRFKSRVRMGKLLQRRVSAPKPRRWPGPRGGTASERGTRGNRAELKHGDQSGPLGPSAAFSTVHPWNSFYRAFGLQ